MDYDIKRTGRRCLTTQRELKPGEEFISELVADGAEMRRIDYCQEAWQGPSDQCIGWWKARIPRSDADKVYWAPRDVLIAYFEHLLQSNQKPETTYLMALLLVRRRVLQFIETHRDEDDREVMELFLSQQKKSYRVAVQKPAQDAIKQIEQELAEHLFVEQPAEEE